jgi:hypothetical protein
MTKIWKFRFVSKCTFSNFSVQQVIVFDGDFSSERIQKKTVLNSFVSNQFGIGDLAVFIGVIIGGFYLSKKF